jgi:hypothetical protein
MRHRNAALIAAPLLAVGAFVAVQVAQGARGARSAATSFTATLNSYQEVPANSTSATGSLTVNLTSTPSLDYELVYSKPSSNVSVAHIHFAQANVSGGVSAFLCGGGGKPACPATGGTVSGTIVAADVVGPAGQGIAAGQFSKLLAAMRRGATYANVHTANFPAGELRGQIRPVP